ncbi:unnamed protein product [Protopolystoma xenopodis]|uniref:Dynein heavy chain C-terminal domain-containing protein n=1 Tax=Protopolystoma xenopodis TaxID=117903 RepID=A0A3S5CBT5_9PLAT|nr:unnamed protein product [Protopolystoma xenopodis]
MVRLTDDADFDVNLDADYDAGETSGNLTTGKSEPPIMWLSGLHHPRAYLTALIQKACRKNGWSLDKCTLHTSVTQVAPDELHTILMAPELGCNISGLFLEGSAWDIEGAGSFDPRLGFNPQSSPFGSNQSPRLLPRIPYLTASMISRHWCHRIRATQGVMSA